MLRAALQMIESIPFPLALIIGVALLLAGGHWLVDGAVRIARLLGVSTLLIGLTVVAFGTSSPELAFNITAAVNGHGELAFGNIIGSNIANIGLVLGLVAIVTRLAVHGRVVRRELPLLVVVTGATLALAGWPAPRREGEAFEITRPDGILLLAAFAVFAHLWYRMARVDRSDPLLAAVEGDARAGRRSPPGRAIAVLLVGLAALVAGGKLTENGAVGFAAWLGLSEALVGLTIVAVATSLPELVTTLIAARRGHADLAVGNVVGSNIFNLLLVMGVTATIAPVPVAAGRGWTDLGVMLGLTLLMVPIALTNNRQVMRSEGVVLLTCYVAYISYGVWLEVG